MAILTCPKCKNKTQEFDIHADTVTCSHCLYDINIPTQLVSDLPRDHKVSKSNKGVIVKQFSNDLEIHLIWKDFSYWKFNLYFGLGLSLFIGVFMFFTAINSSLIGFLFCIPFLFAGAYLCYTGWFLWQNVTDIQIDKTNFSVRHRIRNKGIQDIDIPTSAISQVYVTRKKAGSVNDKILYNHEILLKKENGESIVVVNQIKEAAVAYSIENTLENFLNIKDVVQLEEYHPQKINSNFLPDASHKQFYEAPKGVDISAHPNGLTISFRKNKLALLGLLVPMGFFLFFFQGFSLTPGFPWFLLLIPFGILYFMILSLLRRHTIRLSGLYLWVDIYPDWKFGTKSIDFLASSVQQVFVVRKEIKGEDSTTIVFDLQFIDHQQNIHSLISNYRNPEHLFYAETKIEAFLNIKDSYVAGEYIPH